MPATTGSGDASDHLPHLATEKYTCAARARRS